MSTFYETACRQVKMDLAARSRNNLMALSRNAVVRAGPSTRYAPVKEVAAALVIGYGLYEIHHGYQLAQAAKANAYRREAQEAFKLFLTSASHRPGHVFQVNGQTATWNCTGTPNMVRITFHRPDGTFDETIYTDTSMPPLCP